VKQRGKFALILGASATFLVVILPLLATFHAITSPPAAESPDDPDLSRPLGTILLTTAACTLTVTVVSSSVGWWVGRAARRSPSFARRSLVPMLVGGLALPSYLVFSFWWSLWPPDSGVHAWLVARNLLDEARILTLLVGLAGWSWPLVALCIIAQRGASCGALARVDELSRLARLRLALMEDRLALGAGAAAVALLTAMNVTSFDLAQVFSLGNELRARAALGADPASVLARGWPVLPVVGAVVWGLHRALSRLPHHRVEHRPVRLPLPQVRLLLIVVAATISLPVLVSILRTGLHGAAEFAAVNASSIESTLRHLVLLAFSVLLLALTAFEIAPSAVRRWMLLLWLIPALLPAPMLAALLELVWNDGVSWLASATGRYEGVEIVRLQGTPALLILGHLARFGVLAFAVAEIAVAALSRATGKLMTVDRVEGAARWRARSAVLPLLLLAPLIVAVAAAGEIPLTARLQSPSSDPISARVLNDLHYQRSGEVAAATVFFGVLAGAGVAVGGILWRWRAPMVLLLVIAGGCSSTADDRGEEIQPLVADEGFGSLGLGPSQFSYPRSLAADARGACVYVVDKSARIQRFSLHGELLGWWRMPERDQGKPTGLAVSPSGTLFVADTHYYRVIEFAADGREIRRFGTYGKEPGQFIYPTDVAFGPEGRLYVSEYGGNDRIQVFSPDGKFERVIGRSGEGEGEFDRPQRLLFNADQKELYVADACHHRIVVLDPLTGRLIRSFGKAGTMPGEFHYPYGLAWLEDGTLLVTEFGNHRVQRVSATGEPIEMRGGAGAAPGRLRYPWDVDVAGAHVLVLDSGNNRIQVMREW